MVEGKIYRLKFYEGEDVIHDFVPVRTSGGLVGLYDVVGDLGFRTSATESPYVADESNLVFLDYVESTGTQYFDTGYEPNDDSFGFYLDFRYDDMVGTSGQAQILGSSVQNAGTWGGVCLNGYATTAGGQLRFGSNAVQNPCLVSGQRMQCQLKNRVYTSSTGASVSFGSSEMKYYGSVYLGKIHYESSPANTMKGRYYSFKLFDGDKVVRDYHPAKQGGVVGFTIRSQGTSCQRTSLQVQPFATWRLSACERVWVQCRRDLEAMTLPRGQRSIARPVRTGRMRQ